MKNLYKTDLIRQRRPWRTVEKVKLATLEWMWCRNPQRLHGELDMRTPADGEDPYYVDKESVQPTLAGQVSR